MPDAPPHGVPVIPRTISGDIKKRRELADVAVDEAERVADVEEASERRKARIRLRWALLERLLDPAIWILVGGIAAHVLAALRARLHH